LLLVVKPNLAQPTNVNTDKIVENLHDIAKLAETFTNRKETEEHTVTATFIDQLDMEGMHLSI